MRIIPRRLFERPEARVGSESDIEGGTRTLTLQVDGMLCDVWAGRVQRALEGLGGVDSAEVDLTTGEVTVRAAAGVTGDEMVRAVRGRVILSWARGVLARLKRGGRP